MVEVFADYEEVGGSKKDCKRNAAGKGDRQEVWVSRRCRNGKEVPAVNKRESARREPDIMRRSFTDN